MRTSVENSVKGAALSDGNVGGELETILVDVHIQVAVVHQTEVVPCQHGIAKYEVAWVIMYELKCFFRAVKSKHCVLRVLIVLLENCSCLFPDVFSPGKVLDIVVP